MLERITQNPWMQKLRESPIANLINLPAQVAPPPQFPRLQGAELARQRVHEAIAALQDTGLSKVESFRELRLELNKLEQGRWVAPATIESTEVEPALQHSSRRARLLRATGLY